MRLFPPPDAPIRTLGTERDGRTRVTMGGLRMLVADGGAVEVARDSFAGTIVASAQVAAGWVFAAQDGAVAVSPTFLGQLTPTRDIPDAYDGSDETSAPFGRGRLVVTTRRGAFVTDGVEPPARVSLDHRLIATAAAFADRDRGVAIDVVGALHATSDGGRTWAPVADAFGFTGLEIDGEDIVATGPYAGRQKVARDASLSAAGPLPAVQGRARIEELVRAHIRSEVRAGDRADDHVALPDGRDVRIAADGRWIGPDGRPGPLVEVGDDPAAPALARARGRCRLARRAEVVVVACPGSVLETTDGVTLAPRQVETGVGTVWLAPDGSTVAWLGTRCGSRELGPFACFVSLSDGHSTSIEDSLLDGAIGERMESDRLVARCGTPLSACLVSAQGVSALVAVLGREVLFASDADILSGGRVVASVVNQHESAFLLRADPGRDVELLVVPSSTSRAVFADRDRGLAIGRTLGDVYRTFDGGEHWRRLPLRAEGRGNTSTLSGDAWCNATACGVGTRLRIEQPFAANVGSERVLARRRARVDDEDSEEEGPSAWLTRDPRDDLDCHSAPSRDRDDDDSRRGARAPTTPFEGGRARVAAVDARRTRIEWTVDGATRAVVIPAPALGDPELMRSGWRPVATATPSGVLVSRAAASPAWTWWPVHGAPVEIALPSLGRPVSGAGVASAERTSVRAIPLRDGGTLLLFDDRSMGAAVRLDARGTIRLERAIRARRVFGVAERAGALSLLSPYARRAGDSDLAPVPLEPGAPDELRHPSDDEPLPCRRAPGETWIRTRVHSLGLELERTGDSTCVRALISGPTVLRSDGRALRSADGTFCEP